MPNENMTKEHLYQHLKTVFTYFSTADQTSSHLFSQLQWTLIIFEQYNFFLLIYTHFLFHLLHDHLYISVVFMMQSNFVGKILNSIKPEMQIDLSAQFLYSTTHSSLVKFPLISFSHSNLKPRKCATILLFNSLQIDGWRLLYHFPEVVSFHYLLKISKCSGVLHYFGAVDRILSNTWCKENHDTSF